MGFFSSTVGSVYWSFHEGRLSDEEWGAFLTSAEDAVERGCTNLLTVTYNSVPPNAVQRRKLADRMNRFRTVGKHAFVTTSAESRAVLTMLDWTTTKLHTERTFSNPIDGIEWLVEGQSVSSAEVVVSIRLAVPHDVLHPDLRPG